MLALVFDGSYLESLLLGGGRRLGSLATQLDVKRIDTILREYGKKIHM